MDATDQRLITILRHDGRCSLSDLAAELGITRATVRARLERLKKTGEIIGFTVILRSDAIDLPVRGIMMIEVGGRSADSVIGALNGFPEVSSIHTTNGKWDLVVELGTSDLIEFDQVLRRIRLIPGITNSETSLLLATPRSVRARL
ncbi:Lrp/AsnC family transcriptional regulator [Aquamicrobium defluvii]|uniref:AsnC family transcriptional regulator n=1 Tax=Aquamicrobium defluvii TaxID=69279 RepID=A0A011USX3_9HYPH|nr:Lrp/AsnC family transcriptional regulator [Aquamicrobium defluvii]EXL09361.1 AsnC family transcriptional regulator [Aquamicrobium defluvii]EZQ15526.1 AsnC family transcriptional regulator [Halopseudomonas bauzanensis]TDR36198.1 AsnC family transcriptional regulator [Aquamicrobium defluvii]